MVTYKIERKGGGSKNRSFGQTQDLIKNDNFEVATLHPLLSMNISLKIRHMEHLNNGQSSQLECKVRKVQVCKNLFQNLFLQTSVGVNCIYSQNHLSKTNYGEGGRHPYKKIWRRPLSEKM